jgi:hypothetical protein
VAAVADEFIRAAAWTNAWPRAGAIICATTSGGLRLHLGLRHPELRPHDLDALMAKSTRP